MSKSKYKDFNNLRFGFDLTFELWHLKLFLKGNVKTPPFPMEVEKNAFF